MRDHKLAKHLTNGFQLIWSSDSKIAIAVAISVGVINAFLLAYNTGYVNGEAHSGFLNGTYSSGENFFKTLNDMRFGITIALFISAAGLWVRRTIGLVSSSAALILILSNYTWWYFTTKAYLRNSEVTEQTMLTDPFYKEMGLLHGASAWDWVVLIISIVLFIWGIKTLIGARGSSRVKPRNLWTT
jgi:hypothetical protein